MNAQQAENLRMLIRHMERNVTRTLDMSAVSTNCGTPACALGEATMIPQFGLSLDGLPDSAYVNFRGERTIYFEAASEVFGVSSLFSTWTQLPNGSSTGEPTPRQWADAARDVLTAKGYAMDDGFASFMEKVQQPVALEGAVL